MIFNNPKIVSAFSRKEAKNMSFLFGKDIEMSSANRRDFLSGLGIDCHDLVCAKQVHDNNVSYALEENKGNGALSQDSALTDTDALITDKPSLPLAVFTADCLPVFLYDTKNHAIGLVHAGWRGTELGILSEALKLMQKRFKTRPEDLEAGFGPAIRQCCCEVGEEFNEIFPGCVEKRGENYFFDLAGANKKALLGFGIKEENIADCGICTVCRSNDYFSFRREKEACGRMISVLMLK